MWIRLHFGKLPHTGDAGSDALGSAFVLSAWSGSGEYFFREVQTFWLQQEAVK